MLKTLLIILTVVMSASAGYEFSLTEHAGIPASAEKPRGAEIEDKKPLLSIDGKPVSVTWETNEAVSELAELASGEAITVYTENYGGFEQVGKLPSALTENDITMTAKAGDIVLYAGNSLVLFYGSNTWEYTKLGHVENCSPDELKTLLGGEQTSVTISLS